MLLSESLHKKIYDLIVDKSKTELLYVNTADLSLQISSIYKRTKGKLLVVFDNGIDMLISDLSTLLQEKIYQFPKWDKAIPDEFSPSVDISQRRLETLYHLKTDITQGICVIDKETLNEKIPSSERIRRWIFKLSTGDEFDYDNFLKYLIYSGFEIETNVVNVGEYARRGGIIDIFPHNSEYPVRVELFGNEITSIRYFEPSTQRSFKEIENVEIIPAREIMLFENEIENFVNMYKSYPDPFIEGGEALVKEFRKDDVYFKDYYKKSTVLTCCDKKIGKVNYFISWGIGLVEPIDDINTDIGIKGEIQDKIFYKIVEEYQNWNVLIFLRSKSKIKKLKNKIPNAIFYSFPLSSGFKISDISLLVLTEAELFHIKAHSTKKYRSKNILTRDELVYLPIDSIVIHEKAGIGRYKGTKVIEYRDQKTECLVIEYAESAFLYIPAHKLYLLSRYIGPTGSENIALSVLGSAKWDKKKARAKKVIWDMTMELAELYGARSTSKFSLVHQEHEMVEVVASTFDYEETPDQEKVMEEIYRDLEDKKSMDRLLCGEVGYGKTEVAIRATIKAVNNLYQVAILVPTTILAQQHFDVFKERLQHVPVKVELLSRFVKPQKVKKILKELELGKIDILIGTHRLLSRDVVFKNLGFMVIDEEHKFGVKQKERIKKMKNNIDVLSMSATPIPRTLHMSLWKLMDISLIETPPPGRYSVDTHVLQFSQKIIVDAVNFEIERGGQIFFVHNRIESLPSLFFYLKKNLPNVSIAYAHGRMKASEIEKIMYDFYHHKYDMLLSTTIIESGLDIPNANTLIVDRADTFGLAQLHQIRGRIGRGTKRSYCYFLIPRKGPKTSRGKERLKAIHSYTKLGAGYQLALHDMRIRGVGNLLGLEQSGFDCDIGYELYMKYLEEAVIKIRAGKGDIINSEDVEIHVNFPYYLPPSYIEDTQERVYIYRKISSANLADLTDIKEGVIDRFGKLPDQAENFFKIARLYRLSKNLNWRQVIFYSKIKIEFAESTKRWYIENFVSSLHPEWNPVFKRINKKLYVIIDNWEGNFEKFESFVENLKDKIK